MSIDYGQRFKQAANTEAPNRPPSAFKNAAPGTTVYGCITYVGEQPKLKYNGAPGEVEVDDDGNPVLQLVITLDTPGGPRNLYPTWRMEQAIGAALEQAHAEFEIGATLSVTYTGNDPNSPKAKLYTAKYQPRVVAS